MCRWFYINMKWPPQADFLNICDRVQASCLIKAYIDQGRFRILKKGRGSDEKSVVLQPKKYIVISNLSNIFFFPA